MYHKVIVLWLFVVFLCSKTMVVASSCLNSLQRSGQKLSIMSWNVNGIRSFRKHDAKGKILGEMLKQREVNVLCIQETKLQSIQVAGIDRYLKDNYDIRHSFWSCSRDRKGYSGTAVLMLGESGNFDDKAMTVSYGFNGSEDDDEGRVITVETDKFTLVNVYVPNSGAALARLMYRTDIWDKLLAKHISELQTKRPHVPVILAGDMNVARSALDYHNPEEPRTRLQAGTTPQEQQSFEQCILQGCGMVDTFRLLHPHVQRHSFFSARLGERGRQEQMGMRLDYVLLSTPNHSVETLSSEKNLEAYIEEVSLMLVIVIALCSNC